MWEFLETTFLAGPACQRSRSIDRNPLCEVSPRTISDTPRCAISILRMAWNSLSRTMQRPGALGRPRPWPEDMADPAATSYYRVPVVIWSGRF